MELSVYDWVYQIIVEGIKYILIAHYFLGFVFSKRKVACFLFLYILLIPAVEYLDNRYIIFSYYYAWGGVLLIGLFKEGLKEKIKAFFIIWFLIALVDALIVMLYVMLPTVIFTNQNKEKVMIFGCLGAVFWGVMAFKSKKMQQYTKNFWKRLSNLEYILSLAVLAVGSLFVGGMQGSLDNTTKISMRSTTFILGVIVMLVFTIVLALFLHTKQSKRQLEEINRLNVQYLELQKKYYKDSLNQYEDMRRFRHDINHHLYILSELSREDKVAELKGYIGTMAESYEKMRGIHSGNFIADCLISHTLYQLKGKETFTFDMEGRFPETFFMEDIDFCILLSNLLENAKEALEKIAGECMLQIEVKYFRQWFYLIVRNSTDKDTIDFQVTSKQDRRNHGYGVQNISRIAEKYNGTVQWNCENGMAEVKLKFNVERLK
ncbi:ATP-binding protein [bacterium D16-51]|nr:ATP-binding protein [bacterium D16-59]RKI62692.1 ATP-binding protein [bacterium D16-51]